MSAFPPPGTQQRTNWLTALGLGLVAVGWAVLALDLAVGEAVLKAGSLVATLSVKADVATLAQTLIATGFGFALLGALRQGFGALTRFFDTVLQRSAGPRPATAEAPSAVAEPVETEPLERVPQPGAPARERNYVILPDGSVEVETLLGTRIFATLDEARDFIR